MEKGIIKGELPTCHMVILARLKLNTAPTIYFHGVSEKPIGPMEIYVFKTGFEKWHIRFMTIVINKN